MLVRIDHHRRPTRSFGWWTGTLAQMFGFKGFTVAVWQRKGHGDFVTIIDNDVQPLTHLYQEEATLYAKEQINKRYLVLPIKLRATA